MLFIFPSRYWFTIGHSVIFSLTRWSSQIQEEFHVFLSTWDTIKNAYVFDYRTFTFYGAIFQLLHLTYLYFLDYCPTTLYQKTEFGLIPFRSPLHRESLLLSFPLVTKMFQFTRFALSSLYIQEVVLEVSLFGYFRIKTCFQFPEIFRW